MKKIQFRMWFVWVLLPLLLISCGTKEPNDNILTGLYAPVLEELGTENTTKASAMVPYGDGYAFVRIDQDESYQESMTIVHVDAKGQQTEIPVKMERYGNTYKAGERGVYTFVLSGNNQYDLVMIGWDGTVLAQENISANKPGSATTTTPQAATILTSLPLAETEDGLVLTWGKALLYLDRELHHIETIDLPGQGDMVFADGDTIWVSYTEGNARTLGKVQDKTLVESYPMPESFSGINTYYWLRLIDCQDGWLYAWDTTSVVRWKYGAKEETIETVLDFLGSGLSGQRIRLITMQDKERFCIQTSTDNGLHVAVGLYDKAPDKDLSKMTVLTLATVTNTSEMEEAVLQFNKTHSDSYLKIVSYEQYNTDDEPSKGYTLFMTDLTTGILQADILYGDTSDAMDLYPLMTGTVQKEDIAPCVRRALEKDGKLTSIGSTFYVSTLVGKTDAVSEKYTLTEFLDYAEELQEDEHLMEELSKDSASTNCLVTMVMISSCKITAPLLTIHYLADCWVFWTHSLKRAKNTWQKRKTILLRCWPGRSQRRSLWWNPVLKTCIGMGKSSLCKVRVCKRHGTL